jgi:hypothetical protein
MNRNDLRKFAMKRVRESFILLRNKQYSGAYYLAGYAIECSLKACIARQTKRNDFPDKRLANECYSHNLEKLLKIAGLEHDLQNTIQNNPPFEISWAVTKDWSEESRYQIKSRQEAFDIYQAITNEEHGVLEWIKQHW